MLEETCSHWLVSDRSRVTQINFATLSAELTERWRHNASLTYCILLQALNITGCHSESLGIPAHLVDPGLRQGRREEAGGVGDLQRRHQGRVGDEAVAPARIRGAASQANPPCQGKLKLYSSALASALVLFCLTAVQGHQRQLVKPRTKQQLLAAMQRDVHS